MAECPVCATSIEKDDDVVKGEILECPECGAELEVKTLAPFTLAEAPQEEEDWGE